ncbi:hypothetical protein OESDEN_03742 [Oesophagostomum dentatum]|uniref:Uncharacterized protein n=1 Tax=Oesophagostomum dentatum TaxID=61180 RepID=A0A0B1TFH9_OESDE|nr:hypothetical protein OESDEN_03742 [Oesophagostomum dentatum]
MNEMKPRTVNDLIFVHNGACFSPHRVPNFREDGAVETRALDRGEVRAAAKEAGEETDSLAAAVLLGAVHKMGKEGGAARKAEDREAGEATAKARAVAEAEAVASGEAIEADRTEEVAGEAKEDEVIRVATKEDEDEEVGTVVAEISEATEVLGEVAEADGVAAHDGADGEDEEMVSEADPGGLASEEDGKHALPSITGNRRQFINVIMNIIKIREIKIYKLCAHKHTYTYHPL